jgi:hypothetical protein
MALTNGNEIKASKRRDFKVDFKALGPFFCNKFPQVQPYTVPVLAGEGGLKKAISECKSAVSELEIRLKAALVF